MTLRVHAKADLLEDFARAREVLEDRLGRPPETPEMMSHFGMLFAAYVGAVASMTADPPAVVDEHLAIARRSALALVDEARRGRTLN